MALSTQRYFRAHVLFQTGRTREGGRASYSLVARVDGHLGSVPSTSRSWSHFPTIRASPSVSIQLPVRAFTARMYELERPTPDAKPRKPPICAQPAY